MNDANFQEEQYRIIPYLIACKLQEEVKQIQRFAAAMQAKLEDAYKHEVNLNAKIDHLQAELDDANNKSVQYEAELINAKGREVFLKAENESFQTLFEKVCKDTKEVIARMEAMDKLQMKESANEVMNANAAMQKEIAGYKQIVIQLFPVIDKVRKETDALKLEKKNLTTKLADSLKEKAAILAQCNDALRVTRERDKKLTSEFEDLLITCRKSESDKTVLRHKLKEEHLKLNEALERERQLEKENAKLQEELNVARNNYDKLNQLHEKDAVELYKQRDQNQQLKQDIKDYTRQHEELQASLSKAMTCNDTLECEKELLEQQLANTIEKMTKRVSQKDNALQELKKTEACLLDELNMFQGEMDNKNGIILRQELSLKQAQSRAEELTTRLSEAAVHNQELDTELKESLKANSELKQQLSRITKSDSLLTDEKERLATELAESMNGADQMKAQLKKCREEITGLKQYIAMIDYQKGGIEAEVREYADIFNVLLGLVDQIRDTSNVTLEELCLERVENESLKARLLEQQHQDQPPQVSSLAEEFARCFLNSQNRSQSSVHANSSFFQHIAEDIAPLDLTQDADGEASVTDSGVASGAPSPDASPRDAVAANFCEQFSLRYNMCGFCRNVLSGAMYFLAMIGLLVLVLLIYSPSLPMAYRTLRHTGLPPS